MKMISYKEIFQRVSFQQVLPFFCLMLNQLTMMKTLFLLFQRSSTGLTFVDKTYGFIRVPDVEDVQATLIYDGEFSKQQFLRNFQFTVLKIYFGDGSYFPQREKKY